MTLLLTTDQIKLFPFTDFSAVTPATKLEDLNLNWRESDLPEHIRTKHVHRMHPYLGKFIPQLVEIFLRKYHPSLVVDPFCGSGTTLVEAQALGIDSFGCDVSEFNCLLSKVKTDKYDLNLLEHEILDALTQCEQEIQGRLLEQKKAYTQDYLTQWFAPQALAELLGYRAVVAKYQYQDLLKVILSRAARSARLTTHFDLDFPKRPQLEPYHCYKHSRMCQPTTSARQFLRRYSFDTIKRIREFAAMQNTTQTQIISGDSRYIQFPSCDLVLTSPPYVGLIDYHEQHRYAYELLNLPCHKDNEIGTAKLGNSLTAQKNYLKQIGEVFDNLRRSLKKNAHLVVIVHDRKELYPELAERLNFKVETEIHRKVDRRTGRRAGDFFESVFVWSLDKR